MIAYKGFSKNLTAKLGKGEFQFKMHETVEEKEAKCANTGFHCAEEPLDVLSYYNGKEDRYCIVRAEGDIHEDACGSRISCTKITLLKEISLRELAMEECVFLYKHPNREYNHLVQKEKGEVINNFVIVRGKNPIAKGKIGTALFYLQEKEESSEIVGIGVYEVDGKEKMEGIYYDIRGNEVRDDKERT